jgi:hypothetical protein
MARVTKDDLEHKIDNIKTALGIQTTTTSSVLDNIIRDLDEIKNKLTEADNKSRKFLWLAYYYIPGLALIVAAITGYASIVATINPAHAQCALFVFIIILVVGVAMIIYSLLQIKKNLC